MAEEYYAYEVARFDGEPPAFTYAFAGNYKAIEYYRLDGLDKLRESLAKGVPFAFGFNCFSSIYSDAVRTSGSIPFPGAGEQQVGGHAVMAVGYDDAEKRVLIRDNWGTDWGNYGYATPPHAYVEKGIAQNFWALTRMDVVQIEDGQAPPNRTKASEMIGRVFSRAPKEKADYRAGTAFNSVFEREMREWVMPADRPRQRHHDFPVPQDPSLKNELVGLALSGGGIRSATFSLGACQALARSGVLEHVDYLSTVSGGSYFGSAISSLLHWASYLPGKGHPLAKENFPFRFGPDPGGEVRQFKGERPPVRRLREMSNYLAPRLGFFDTQTWYAVIRIVTHTVALLVSFALPPLILVLTALTFVPGDVWNRSDPIETPTAIAYPLALAAIALVIFALVSSSPLGKGSWSARLGRFSLYVVLGALAFLILVLAVWLAHLSQIPAEIKTALGTGSVVGLIAAARWAYSRLGELGRRLETDFSGSSVGQRIRLRLPQVLFGALGYFVLAMLVVLSFIVLDEFILGLARWIAAAIALALTIPALFSPKVIGWLNGWSLHSFYRDRLRDAYVQSEGGSVRKAHLSLGDMQRERVIYGEQADRPLGNLQAGKRALQPGHEEVMGPYHVIGCALNISGSTDLELLGRRADPFFLAPLYSGSSITGFVHTHQAYGESLTLGDAMAISGAAFSPNQGSATNTSLAILLTLLNARLGYWLPNPMSSHQEAKPKLISSSPLVLYWKEMFGKASSDDDDIYLSDGGHFDNSGIYELVRRRCRFIIAIDGSGEPPLEPPRFGSLGLACRLVRIDFGVDIQLDLATLITDDSGRSGAYYAVGRIEYPRTSDADPVDEGERSGLLIYLKATMTKDMTAPDLEFYRRLTSVFPNHSTADQFFDEGQFESYRGLGYRVAHAVFGHSPELPETGSDDSLRTLRDRWNALVGATAAKKTL